jgi:hypothetical protein
MSTPDDDEVSSCVIACGKCSGAGFDPDGEM